MGIRVYVVEDHDIMREMIIEFVTRHSAIEAVGSAASAEQALEELDALEKGDDPGADLALVDTSLPEMNGIELVATLRERYPGLRCVMVSGHSELTYVRRALEAGAEGYILKGDPYEFETAIERIVEGERYISGSLRDEMAPD
jgi:DNA-binding NarL/FixJ family response regulator